MVTIFVDSADFTPLEGVLKNPLVAGVTTNPSLILKAGIKDYKRFASYVLSKVGDRPVSLEVFADDLEGMKRQAKEIASWGKNVFVKIPITNTVGESTAPVIESLDIQWNVTAIFTIEQMVVATKALRGPSIISVFAGRIADTGVDPVDLIRMGLVAIKPYRKPGLKVLWASAREVFNVKQAEAAGCDIITLAPDFIAKLSMFGKDLNAYSLETVRQFKRDAEGLKL